MTVEYRRKIVGALLLTAAMGLFAIVISDIKHGLLTAGCVFISLVIAENL